MNPWSPRPLLAASRSLGRRTMSTSCVLRTAASCHTRNPGCPRVPAGYRVKPMVPLQRARGSHHSLSDGFHSSNHPFPANFPDDKTAHVRSFFSSVPLASSTSVQVLDRSDFGWGLLAGQLPPRELHANSL